MQRRSLLKLGVASAALLAIAGGSLALLQPGLAQARLTLASREVFAALGSAVLDGTLPAEPAARRRAVEGLLDRLDGLIAGLPAHAQEELSQLLALLASTPGRRSFAGLSSQWRDASIPELQASLQAMRLSTLALRQQAYQALHDLIAGAYFSDSATWSLLGYPGPTPA